MDKYMGTAEAAEKWGLSREYVAKLCRDGKISGAVRDVHSGFWKIPIDAAYPSVRKNKLGFQGVG